MECVEFLINNNSVSFEADLETCVLLLTDDDYTLDYLRRAAISGGLTKYGVSNSNFDTAIFERRANQQHCPEALRQIGIDTCPDNNNCDLNETSQNENNGINIDKNSSNIVVWQLHQKATENDAAATKLLLQLRGAEDMKKKFNDKKHNKYSLWKKIAESIEQAGYKICIDGKDPAEKCRQKFANLQKSYINFMDNSKRTGAQYLPKPSFFDDLHNIFDNKDKVNPPYLVDSFEEIPRSTRSIQPSEKPSKKPLENPSSSIIQDVAANTNLSSSVASNNSRASNKNVLINVLKEMHNSQLAELKKVTSIIKENVENQNKHTEVQIQQRNQLIEILKGLCKKENSKKHKRKYTSSSDE